MTPVASVAENKVARKTPLYATLWAQVLIAIILAVALGYFNPAAAIAMKPLGDGFIKLITMIITAVIFCTVVSGIAGMQDIKKVGRVGGKALLYFEIVSTLALLLGMVIGNVVRPGKGLDVNPATLDAKAVAEYAGQAKAQSAKDFVLHIIPIRWWMLLPRAIFFKSCSWPFCSVLHYLLWGRGANSWLTSLRF
jgi:aerobic C4-dicarboxylate transport protein